MVLSLSILVIAVVLAKMKKLRESLIKLLVAQAVAVGLSDGRVLLAPRKCRKPEGTIGTTKLLVTKSRQGASNGQGNAQSSSSAIMVV